MKLRTILKWIGIGFLLLLITGYGALRARTIEDRPVAAAPLGPVAEADLARTRAEPTKVQGWDGVDLRHSDFSAVKASDLWKMSFDTRTQWPDPAHMPAGFDPQKVIEAGKDPGLGIAALHAKGLTGKGVHVAVIDNPMRPAHQEFENRLTYTLINPLHINAGLIHFHGAATASILAGKTVGVAPESYVHFYGLPGTLGNFGEIASAIDKILEYNQGHPRAEQVRVISISMGMPDDLFRAATQKAEAAGIAVVHCGNWFPVRYIMAGAAPDRDRNDPKAYEAGLYIRGPVGGGMLFVPTDYRTTASSDGPDVYAYWGQGGASWAAPWLAGLITLGVQANPDLTPAQAYKALDETAADAGNGYRVVNPAGFIERVQHK